MAALSFESLRPSYAKLWADLEPTPSRIPELKIICGQLIVDKAVYGDVATAVWGRPDLWFIVALIDQMEHSPRLGLCNSHLHNGDPLIRRTVQIPAGRPPGEPQGTMLPDGIARAFTFQQSAVDALTYGALDKVKDWPIERIAYSFEAYNGWGYLDKPIADPYLAAWSNKYTKGKFTGDHHFDPEAVSEQPGALTILKVLVTMAPDVAAAVGGATSTLSAPKPKEITMPNGPSTVAPAAAAAGATGQVPAAAAAAPNIDLAAIELNLEHIAPMVGFITTFIPPPWGAIVTAAIPALETVLKMAASVEAAPDLQSKFAALEGHFSDLSTVFGQIKGMVATASTKTT